MKKSQKALGAAALAVTVVLGGLGWHELGSIRPQPELAALPPPHLPDRPDKDAPPLTPQLQTSTVSGSTVLKMPVIPFAAQQQNHKPTVLERAPWPWEEAIG